jgi:hypothetical protein
MNMRLLLVSPGPSVAAQRSCAAGKKNPKMACAQFLMRPARMHGDNETEKE